MGYVLMCYRKPGDVPDYEEIPYEQIDKWKSAHPDHVVTHVFNVEKNLVLYDEHLRTEFLKRCQDYHMGPDALSKSYVDNKGNRYSLLGIRPENTKYKFVILNRDTGKRFKVSPDYLRSLAPIAPQSGG